jgi:hypothetical protein
MYFSVIVIIALTSKETKYVTRNCSLLFHVFGCRYNCINYELSTNIINDSKNIKKSLAKL